jgi:hypothetical protein
MQNIYRLGLAQPTQHGAGCTNIHASILVHFLANFGTLKSMYSYVFDLTHTNPY